MRRKKFGINKNLYSLIIISALLIISFSIIIYHSIYDKNIFKESIKLSGGKEISAIPIINGNREGCLVCHSGMKGFSSSHDPEAIGCFSCHQGNPLSIDKKTAHENLIKIPGNLDTAEKSCGKSGCHDDIVKRVKNSLMGTGRGMVSVNRFVFGESSTPDGTGHLSKLSKSPADTHLKQLCSPCHLGNSKKIIGPAVDDFTGGGCLACHLEYSKDAESDLQKYLKTKLLMKTHPKLSVNADNSKCFECHNRSARISTNYEGWHETLISKDEIPKKGNYRVLADGRVFEKKPHDIHHEKGLQCIDCHTARETMGDGKSYNHQEEQVEISCEDCHRISKPKTVSYNQLDDESKKILKLRKENTDKKYLLLKKNGRPVINIFQDNDGRLFLKSKLNLPKGKQNIYNLKVPSDICSKAVSGHDRLSCQSCHTSWSPTCISCHTKFNPESGLFKKAERHLFNKNSGVWEEYIDHFYALPPALGIRLKNGVEKIDTFIPGMVLTIDGIDNGQFKQKNGEKSYQIFKRLYAPTSSHTIVKNGRTCESCHSDSRTLGFGTGKLNIEKIEKENVEIFFESEYINHPVDNLPLDSWIKPFSELKEPASTRTGARPFNTKEQKKILVVGRCLSCHKGTDVNIKMIYSNFTKAIKTRKSFCN